MLIRYGLKNSEDLLNSPDLFQAFLSKRKLPNINLPSLKTVAGVAGGVVLGKALLSIAGSLLGASLDFL